MIVGPFQFDRPWWLLLAPVAIVLSLLIARKSLTGLSPAVQRVAMAIRIIALILASMALAEPSYRLTSDGVTLLVVADASKSMPSTVDKALQTYLEQALTEAPPGSRMGYVTAAAAPRAHALPSSRVPVLTQYQDVVKAGTLDVGSREGTNLEGAARLGLAIKPEDTAARLMIVSDGNETVGSLLALADTAKMAGVPIDVLPITYAIEREMKFDGLLAPPTARAGQTVNLRFAITSTREAQVRLGLMLNGESFDLTPGEEGAMSVASLVPGSNIVTVPVLLPRGGPQEFEAVLEPVDAAADTISQNNSASAVTFVSTEGMVLVYSAQASSSLGFVNALEQSRLQVDVRDPASSGHGSLVELQKYDAIVLFDTPAGAFSRKQQEELAAYTRDSGGGLVMVGGPNSFGAGGWLGTPVADALPVRLDPPEKRQIPRGALALVMHSCEMPEGNYWGQKTALAAANALARLDLVGVAEYDHMTGARWAYRLQEKGDGVGVAAAIKGLRFGDMPDFDTAMQLAVDDLVPAKAGQKHMIVISDGDPSPPSNQLIQAMISNKISCSTVAVFPHSSQFQGTGGRDIATMKSIAQKTGGRFYFVNSTAGLGQLPEIFIKESQTVKRTLIWEGEAVRPTLVNSAAEAMRGISSSLPPISGYVVTADREGLSMITAKGPNDDPIVAQWQYGLGRSIAFTSDAASRWSSAWLGWGQFRAFWDQHIRWAMRPTGSANLSVATESRGDSTRVVVTALDATGDALNFARFQGRVVGPEGATQVVELRQSGPGRYEGEFKSGAAGSYLVNLRYDAPKTDAEGKSAGIESGTVQAAVTRPFADEHRALRDNAALLRQVAEVTGGRVLNTSGMSAELFDRTGLTMPVATTPIWMPLALAAIGVFLTDVGVRRVRIDIPAMARATRRLFSRSKGKSAEQLAGLRAARETARTRLAERGAGEARGEGTAGTSGVKFDAGADAMAGAPRSPLDAASPPPETRPAPVAGEAPKDDEPGMSRLLQAKRRAQQNMKDDEPRS